MSALQKPWSKEAEFLRSIFSGTTDAQRIATLEAKLAVAREALEDLCAEKHGARPRALRALKEIEQ